MVFTSPMFGGKFFEESGKFFCLVGTFGIPFRFEVDDVGHVGNHIYLLLSVRAKGTRACY